MNIKSAKILIVEDEIQINRLIELSLISDGFYNIKKAFDGIDALNKIQADKILPVVYSYCGYRAGKAN